MEIVFEPDLFDGEEAASLIKELTLILQVFTYILFLFCFFNYAFILKSHINATLFTTGTDSFKDFEV